MESGECQQILFVDRSYLCGSLRISAFSALKDRFNAESRRDIHSRPAFLVSSLIRFLFWIHWHPLLPQCICLPRFT